MYQLSLANVLLPAHRQTAPTAGFQQMRERPLQLLAPLQPLAAGASDRPVFVVGPLAGMRASICTVHRRVR